MPSYASFASVQTIDTNTVKITFKTWDSTVIYNLASGPGLIVSAENYLNNGAAYAADHPVGTGPFKFVSWSKNNKITYTRNPDYWQPGKPYLDGIEWYTIPDMNTKALSFLNGELDVVITLDLPQVQMIEKAGYKPYLQPVSGGADGFVPNSANASSPWSNLKVRQAAAYAINNAEMTQALFGALGQPANQFVPKGNWAYNPDVVGYPYNPDKAKQLLTEAGYPTGFKTVFNGFQDATMNNRVLAVSEYLKKVGIICDIQIISNAQLVDKQTNGFGWDGLIWNSLGQSMDVTDTLNRYYSASEKTFVSMLKPPDWVKGIKDAVAAPDFTTKQKLVQGLMKMMTDTYCLMLLQQTRLDDAFEGKAVRDTGITRTINTQMWTPENAWLDK
jgi:ABC-type transport system substrate-binding protein